MIATFLCENIQKKISFLNHVVSQKSQLVVLSNILIETNRGKLYISSTDLEIGLKIEIPANIKEEGGTTVPAKTFSELINMLPSGKITLEAKDGSLEVKTDKTKNVFQTIPKEEFPNLYEEMGEKIMDIPKDVMQNCFTKVVFSASSDIDRPALSGVLIKTSDDGNIVLVATDGFRLSFKNFNCKTEKETEEAIKKPIIVPARVLREAVMLKDEEKGMAMFIAKKNNQVLFQNGTALLVGRLIEAEFPNYERIIPQSFLTQFFFDREELQKAVKICAIFARETANIIKLSFKKDAAVVSANTPSVGENTVEVEGKLVGDENQIAFNARYLLDLFSNVSESEMVFEMNDPFQSGVFKIKDDSSFLHLIMPIRVQG